MKILNPIYDYVFKYLMENDVFARKIISVILDKEVVEVSLSQQETFLKTEKRALKMYRLDFKAIIKERDGSKKKVLIEVQKSKHPVDIYRFRNYLAASYMSEINESPQKDWGSVLSDQSIQYKPIQPIIAIYILGYNLDDLPHLAVSVNRDVIDSVSKKKLDVNCFFIDHLTHEAHIIQVGRLPERPASLLEKLFMLFSPRDYKNNAFVVNLPEVPEEFQDVARYLQRPVMDIDFHRMLLAEIEVDLMFDEQEMRHLKELEREQIKLERIKKQKALALREKKKAEKQKEKAITEKDRAITEKERAIIQKEEAVRHKQALAVKLARQMKKNGSNKKEILKETGLAIEELEKL